MRIVACTWAMDVALTMASGGVEDSCPDRSSRHAASSEGSTETASPSSVRNWLTTVFTQHSL
jgi:hypothetical protein